MENASLIAAAGGIGAIATAMVTWAIATRTHSGRVNTTDAERLWEQVNKLTDALTQDNTGLRVRIDSLTAENDNLRARMHTLEIKQQQTELAESECNERADRLQREMTALKKRLGVEDTVEQVIVQGEHLEAKGPESVGGSQ